jgi:hypothetical protein
MELSDFPPFAEWLKSKIKEAERAGRPLEDDIKHYAQLPERNATSHRQMYCHGKHLRVRSSEGALVTRDSGVVVSFNRQVRWGLVNGRPVERTQEYVGYIEEILVLDYRNHCVTVLICDWVRGTRDNRNPSILRDRYGFSLANFNQMDGKVHADSFAFPLHCQQVFFSDDPHRRGWKVVCRTEVRGRRTAVHSAESIPNIVQLQNDANFDGLQPVQRAVDLVQRPVHTGEDFLGVVGNDAASEEEL